MLHAVVIRLTIRSLLGGRRLLAFLLLPALLLALSILVRVLGGEDVDAARAIAALFGLGTLMPLLGLLAGTGAIGPEIGDGSIVYVLAKPLRRRRIIVSKLVVASGVAILFGAVPIWLVGLILTGDPGGIALAIAVAALVAAVAYCALFLLLAVVTRNAVVIGLLYALVWETTVGQFIPGAQALSVQQWSLAIAERMPTPEGLAWDLEAAVDVSTGAPLLAALIIGSTIAATWLLRRLPVTTAAE